MPRIIGVDVGGTFTDVVVADEGGIAGRKVPTTVDQSEAVAETVDGSSDDMFLHGTTAATNALLEGKGGSVALITDAGYEDVIEIGRQDRPSLYDSAADRPQPLVKRSMRFGYEGDSLATVESVYATDPDAVAVCLIESYQDPAVESELATALRDAGDATVVLSSEVSPEFREFERTATTALAAYLAPSVSSYLKRLESRLVMDTRLIMTSSGGLIPFESGPGQAGRLVLSGPAGGAVAAAALGRHHGHQTVLAFDMGGTSTDVCRIEGGVVDVGAGHTIGGRVNRIPSVPIQTIGAGGGSIGWADSGGALRVGPHSAGSQPGPACYGRGGTEPTVTDANVVLGNIPSDLSLGGTVTLDLAAARDAMSSLGQVIGLEIEEVAAGIIEVVDSHMEHALRAVSVEQGTDPREAVLVAFGGAGGLHATRLARRLGIGTVLIPPLSGVFSALGLMMATPRTDTARTVMLDENAPQLEEITTELLSEVETRFGQVFGLEASHTEAFADVRYFGQSHELSVEAGEWSVVRHRFEEMHRHRFGFSRPEEPIEVVNIRTVAVGEPPLSWDELPSHPTDLPTPEVAGVMKRSSLPVGFEVSGSGVVVEDNSAVLLVSGDVLTVLEDGTLEITCG